MKKAILSMIAVLGAAVAFAPAPASAATSLSETLKGRILLQVESKGQAWYVNPVNLKRAYLGRPVDALNIMRGLGLGITDADLARIAEPGKENTDTVFARRLAGRILLQVESKGEAWYVNSLDLKRYYLGRPIDALRIMWQYGLGVSNANLAKIPVDSRFPEAVYATRTYDVSIRDLAFDPAALTINRGDSLVWTNLDAANHTVSPVNAGLPGFGSGVLATGQKYRFTFTQAGTYDYYCTLHPNMTARVVVR